MLKVIHIHHDTKFVFSTSFFEGSLFNNIVIIFNETDKNQGVYKGRTIYLKNTLNDVNRAIEFCKDADLVVLYNLDPIKSFIANRLPKKNKVAWRFFGSELYSDEFSCSDLTLDVISSRWYHTLWNIPVKIARRLKSYVVWRTDFNIEFAKAVKRMDYFLCLSRDEYDFLKIRYRGLPQFIQTPYHWLQPIHAPIASDKKPVVVVGNSRSYHNNHMDILEIITKSAHNKYKYALLFNYGTENKYTKVIREKVRNYPQIYFIDDFMPWKEYKHFYSQVSALVINTYRQMAMGNILDALRNGAKVYLNKNNIVLQWLRNEGFLVFTIEDFVLDLEHDKLELTYSEIVHNQGQINCLINSYPQKNFQKTIYDAVAGENWTDF